MTMRLVHAIVAVVFVVAILVQVFLAGAALLQLGGNGDFRAHADFGYTEVGIAALLVLVTAALAKVGRRRIGLSALLLVLYIVQTLLPAARGSMPSVAALHPVNAMVLFALAAWFAWTAWRDRAATGPAPSSAPAA
ncbi:MAG TPA: DUF6220 domain-containing protein [Candidatus Limnocylindrales bacterium]|nr:DUF6220 domain-containing protein [Candidatus Limnocylindrales bacterium]